MSMLSKILIVMAIISLAAALFIKFSTVGTILPGPVALNWSRLADTFLLFSIAVSLLGRNKQ
jgi:hypothetical protein